MSKPFEFTVERASWTTDQSDLRSVRVAVFVEEQGVPIDLEWDGLDDASAHVLARDVAGVAIGTGRLLPDRKIGRMAVLCSARGKGVGAAILRTLLLMARARGDDEIELSAQIQALGFYEKSGFTAVGEEYMDAGIPHRNMRLRLTGT